MCLNVFWMCSQRCLLTSCWSTSRSRRGSTRPARSRWSTSTRPTSGRTATRPRSASTRSASTQKSCVRLCGVRRHTLITVDLITCDRAAEIRRVCLFVQAWICWWGRRTAWCCWIGAVRAKFTIWSIDGASNRWTSWRASTSWSPSQVGSDLRRWRRMNYFFSAFTRDDGDSAERSSLLPLISHLCSSYCLVAQFPVSPGYCCLCDVRALPAALDSE